MSKEALLVQKQVDAICRQLGAIEAELANLLPMKQRLLDQLRALDNVATGLRAAPVPTVAATMPKVADTPKVPPERA